LRLRVHRVPYSTNVERVALAAAHKGLEVEWVDHDPGDRSGVRAVSGQDLVPVAELGDGEVVIDSMAIVERLEQAVPEPRLYPLDPGARALVDVFVAWFNGVWKVAPNALEAEEATKSPDRARLGRLGEELAGSRRIFEGLLAAGPFLLGPAMTAADVCAFPFLKWATMAVAPPAAPRFEHILVEHLGLRSDHRRLLAWIERMDELPRA
jgi:glutathione S-transferase